MVSRKIYADNAATTRLDIDAFEVMKKYMLDEYANPSAKYSFSREPSKALENSRAIIANCINADKSEIFFTSGGTEGDNWILKGISHSMSDGGNIIVSEIEHHAVLESCKWLEKKGFTITYLPVNKDGLVEPKYLEAAIKSDTFLVSVMYANNEVGSIQPIKELVDIAHKHGVLFHTDAIQAVGHIPIDVKKVGVDFMTASAHKFNGYKGTGFAYISSSINIDSLISGGSQEKKKRAGTENVAGIVAMEVALKKNCDEVNQHIKQLQLISDTLIKELREYKIDFIKNGASNSLPGIVNLSFLNADGEMLMHRLDFKGIYVSTGAACNSKETVASYVLKAMKVPEEYIKGTIRLSFGNENTVLDAKCIAKAIYDIFGKEENRRIVNELK